MWIRGRAWDSRALAAFVRSGSVSPGLARLVRECLSVKARLVERDPLDERRVRELLNFGHTVGHALESAAGGRLSHGECVLWGMAVETSLLGAGARAQDAECRAALRALAGAAPPELAALDEAEWLEYLAADKKSRGGKIEMSLLERPGRAVKKRFAPAKLAAAIRAYRV
jgi:3-dehydroquinate synthase